MDREPRALDVREGPEPEQLKQVRWIRVDSIQAIFWLLKSALLFLHWQLLYLLKGDGRK